MSHFGIFDSIQALTNITRPFVRPTHKERGDNIRTTARDRPIGYFIEVSYSHQTSHKTKYTFHSITIISSM